MDRELYEDKFEENPETPADGAGEPLTEETSAGCEEADAVQMADAEQESDPEAGDAEESVDSDGAEDAEDGAGEEDGPKQDADGKWRIFGKKKEKKDPRDQQIEELTDQLRRNMAEFDNFRKRTEKEKSAMFEVGAKNVIERILPVIDNFERGLSAIPEDAKGTPFAEGMEMIYKQLLKNLEDAGVKPIEAAGQPFDPNFHNAVMHVEDENLEENVVAQELQKGYMYRDSVVRHSMVSVAN